MKPIDQFEGQLYLNLETFRRSGEGVKTPVWFVQDGETFYIRTLAGSGKVKRLRNNPKVHVAACKADGQPLGDWWPARGRELRGDPAIEQKVDRLLDVKYGEIKREMARRNAEAGRKYTILEIVLGSPTGG